jgi:hypothetical protein
VLALAVIRRQAGLAFDSFEGEDTSTLWKSTVVEGFSRMGFLTCVGLLGYVPADVGFHIQAQSSGFLPALGKLVDGLPELLFGN